MRRSSVAALDTTVGAAPAPGSGERDLDALRTRLSGATAREAVLVDFLEDDVADAEATVAELSEWLAAVARALRNPRVTRQELVALAARRDCGEDLDHLGGVLASVRRRLALVSVGLARAGE